MSVMRKVILGSVLASAMLAGPIYAGVDVNIGIGVPLFYAAPAPPNRVYYRTYNGYPYYYDHDRGGWYYGHNREEGQREYERRGRDKHHNKKHHDHGRHGD